MGIIIKCSAVIVHLLDHLTEKTGILFTLKLYIVLHIHGSVHRESNLITVQQEVTYSVYYISVGSSTRFRC